MKIDEIIGAENRRMALKQMHRGGAIYDLINREYGLGFEPLADGEFATILVHPNLNYVLKLFDSTDAGYKMFIQIALAHKDNPHFPRFRGRPVNFGKFSTIRMEKLVPIHPNRFADIEYMIHKAMTDDNWKKDIWPNSEFDDFLKKWPKFGNALDIIRTAFKNRVNQKISLDFHEGNIMLRPENGAPVITDPFAILKWSI